MEPEIQDKIRVREIEVLDNEDNVIARIGAKDGIYEEDGDYESVNVFTVYDSEELPVVKVGKDENGGEFTISGANGLVHIRTIRYGGLFQISHYDGDDLHKLVITSDQRFAGLFEFFSRGCIEVYKNKHKISFEADVNNGSVSIRGKNGTIETLKKIFNIGS